MSERDQHYREPALGSLEEAAREGDHDRAAQWLALLVDLGAPGDFSAAAATRWEERARALRTGVAAPDAALVETAAADYRGLFGVLLDQSIDGIALNARKPPRLLEVSNSFCAMTGYSREELIGRTSVEQEFWQSERSTDEANRGTGLGLALTKKLVELHGGRVTVTSELGAGSTFTVILPLGKSALELLEHPSDDVVSDKPLVLVAEDDKAIAELLARWIRSSGYIVKLVRSGAEVLESARSLRPRFVTLDVLMPNTDGWSALPALKQDPETAGIPVIVVTIVDEPGIAAAKGADAYILKPVTRESILSVLARFEPTPNNGELQPESHAIVSTAR